LRSTSRADLCSARLPAGGAHGPHPRACARWARRALGALVLAGALGACSWLPFVGGEEKPAGTLDEPTIEEPQSARDQGVCRRKGRSWPEGSRVCEEHMVKRCFPDGKWYVIGSC
jgi:hypothetical protein